MRRLYFDDPLLFDFEAEVVATSSWMGVPSILLDQTAFYPEGGGQLGDRGVLGGSPIKDVQIDDHARIHHLVDGFSFQVGDKVEGSVDASRRRQHMSLHTAQHMLSRALLDRCGAQTISSRLGEQSCTVDINLETVPDVDLYRVQDVVCQLVEEARPVRTFFPTSEELEKLSLRRAPKVTEGIRVVEVEGFDCSPCGGTHCTSTAQIGAFQITGSERYKGMFRVSFAAGRRSLNRFVREAAILRSLAADLTCGSDHVPAAVAKLRKDVTQQRSKMKVLREELTRLRADELLAKARVSGGQQVVAVWDGYGMDMLQQIASRICREEGMVACLAGVSGDTLDVVIASHEGSSFDCGTFMKRLTSLSKGRGGGRATMAQGSFPIQTDWAQLVRTALEHGS